MAVCRIAPETKPRNPKLADVLRVYRKWEGRSIGMPTLVRLLAAYDPIPELRRLLGASFDGLDNFRKQVLGIVLRFNRHSKQGVVSARQTSLTLWEEGEGDQRDIRGYETLYRKVKYVFNRLEKAGFVVKKAGTRDYEVNVDYLKTHLL